MDEAKPHTRVLYPWIQGGDTYTFTGVPPRVAVLHNVLSLYERHSTLVTDFLDGLTGALDQHAIGGGNLTKEQLKHCE